MPLILSIVATAWLFFGVIYFGAKKPGYSHLRHSISELGEFGSQYMKGVNFGIFLPVGLLLMVIPFLDGFHGFRAGLAASISIGYIVAAFFPCDPGSPTTGSYRQQVHNLGGFIEYAGGAFALIRSGEQDLSFYGINYKVFGYIIIPCIILISIPSNPLRGIIQRIAELVLLGTLIHLSTL